MHKMLRAIFFFAGIFLVSGLLDPRLLTCEECVLLVAEYQLEMTQHDHAITSHLNETFCQEEELDEQECRRIAGHYPGMLDVVVGMDVDPLATCIHDHECEGGKSSVVACEDCEHIGRIIKEHISGPDNMPRMLNHLHQHYCPHHMELHDCNALVERYFPEMHTEIMDTYLRPHQVCIHLEYCEE